MAENLATEMAARRIETSLLPVRDGHYRSSAKGQVINVRIEQEDNQTLLLSCSCSISLSFHLLDVLLAGNLERKMLHFFPLCTKYSLSMLFLIT